MQISHQVRRYGDRKLGRKLELSALTYEANDANLIFSSMGPLLLGFTRVIILPVFLKEYQSIA